MMRGWWSDNCKNCGSIIGGFGQLVLFLSILAEYASKLPWSVLVRLDYGEQIIVNPLIKTGFFQERGVSFKFWKEGDPYIAAWGFFGRKNVTYELGKFRLFENVMYPLVIHMFDRERQFFFSVLEACPVLFETGWAYMRQR
jgi:hypothetical protein